MKLILRHGNTIPKNEDLDEYQFGICSANNKIYTKIKNEIIALNDYENELLKENEYRTFDFDGLESTDQVIETIKILENIDLSIYRKGYKIFRLDFPKISGGIDFLSFNNTYGNFSDTKETDKYVLDLSLVDFEDYPFQEFIITINNNFSIKLGIYVSVANKSSKITIENLNFRTEEDLTI